MSQSGIKETYNKIITKYKNIESYNGAKDLQEELKSAIKKTGKLVTQFTNQSKNQSKNNALEALEFQKTKFQLEEQLKAQSEKLDSLKRQQQSLGSEEEKKKGEGELAMKELNNMHSGITELWVKRFWLYGQFQKEVQSPKNHNWNNFITNSTQNLQNLNAQYESIFQKMKEVNDVKSLERFAETQIYSIGISDSGMKDLCGKFAEEQLNILGGWIKSQKPTDNEKKYLEGEILHFPRFQDGLNLKIDGTDELTNQYQLWIEGFQNIIQKKKSEQEENAWKKIAMEGKINQANAKIQNLQEQINLNAKQIEEDEAKVVQFYQEVSYAQTYFPKYIEMQKNVTAALKKAEGNMKEIENLRVQYEKDLEGVADHTGTTNEFEIPTATKTLETQSMKYKTQLISLNEAKEAVDNLYIKMQNTSLEEGAKEVFNKIVAGKILPKVEGLRAMVNSGIATTKGNIEAVEKQIKALADREIDAFLEVYNKAIPLRTQQYDKVINILYTNVNDLNATRLEMEKESNALPNKIKELKNGALSTTYEGQITELKAKSSKLSDLRAELENSLKKYMAAEAEANKSATTVENAKKTLESVRQCLPTLYTDGAKEKERYVRKITEPTEGQLGLDKEIKGNVNNQIKLIETNSETSVYDLQQNLTEYSEYIKRLGKTSINDLNARITQTLVEKKENIAAQFTNIQKIIEQYNESVKALDASRDKLAKQVTNLKQRYETIQTLHTSKDSNAEKIKKLNDEYKTYCALYNEYRTAESKHKKLVGDAKLQVKKDEIEGLKWQYAADVKAFEEDPRVVALGMNKIETTFTECEEHKEFVAAQGLEDSTAAQKLVDAVAELGKKEYEEKAQKLAEERTTIEQKGAIKQAKDALEVLKKEAKKVNSVVDELNQQNGELDKIFAKIEAERNKITGASQADVIASAIKELKDLEVKYDVALKEYTELEKDGGDYKKALDGYEEQKLNYENNKKAVEKEINELNPRIAKHNEEVNEWNGENNGNLKYQVNANVAGIVVDIWNNEVNGVVPNGPTEHVDKTQDIQNAIKEAEEIAKQKVDTLARAAAQLKEERTEIELEGTALAEEIKTHNGEFEKSENQYNTLKELENKLRGEPQQNDPDFATQYRKYVEKVKGYNDLLDKQKSKIGTTNREAGILQDRRDNYDNKIKEYNEKIENIKIQIEKHKSLRSQDKDNQFNIAILKDPKALEEEEKEVLKEELKKILEGKEEVLEGKEEVLEKILEGEKKVLKEALKEVLKEALKKILEGKKAQNNVDEILKEYDNKISDILKGRKGKWSSSAYQFTSGHLHKYTIASDLTTKFERASAEYARKLEEQEVALARERDAELKKQKNALKTLEAAEGVVNRVVDALNNKSDELDEIFAKITEKKEVENIETVIKKLNKLKGEYELALEGYNELKEEYELASVGYNNEKEKYNQKKGTAEGEMKILNDKIGKHLIGVDEWNGENAKYQVKANVAEIDKKIWENGVDDEKSKAKVKEVDLGDLDIKLGNLDIKHKEQETKIENAIKRAQEIQGIAQKKAEALEQQVKELVEGARKLCEQIKTGVKEVKMKCHERNDGTGSNPSYEVTGEMTFEKIVDIKKDIKKEIEGIKDAKGADNVTPYIKKIDLEYINKPVTLSVMKKINDREYQETSETKTAEVWHTQIKKDIEDILGENAENAKKIRDKYPSLKKEGRRGHEGQMEHLKNNAPHLLKPYQDMISLVNVQKIVDRKHSSKDDTTIWDGDKQDLRNVCEYFKEKGLPVKIKDWINAIKGNTLFCKELKREYSDILKGGQQEGQQVVRVFALNNTQGTGSQFNSKALSQQGPQQDLQEKKPQFLTKSTQGGQVKSSQINQ